MDQKYKNLESAEDLSILTGHAFEEYLCQLFTDLGYEAQKTPGSGDFGADIILTTPSSKIAVQAKQYSSDVGFDAVKEVFYAKSHYGADEAWVVCTRSYTRQAITAARKTDVKLVSGRELNRLISDAKKGIGHVSFDGGEKMPDEPYHCELCGEWYFERIAEGYKCENCGARYVPDDTGKNLRMLKSKIKGNAWKEPFRKGIDKLTSYEYWAEELAPESFTESPAEIYQSVFNLIQEACRTPEARFKAASEAVDESIAELRKYHESDRIGKWPGKPDPAGLAIAKALGDCAELCVLAARDQDDLTSYKQLAAKAYKEASDLLLHTCVQSNTERAGVDRVYSDKVREVEPDYVSELERIVAKTDGSSGCYIATCVYGSYDCPHVWTLRRFRNYGLAKSHHGRVFIKAYYAISPTIVRWFGKTEVFKRLWRGPLDLLVRNCHAKGYADTPYEDMHW